MKRLLSRLPACLLALFLASSLRAAEITVFAAASLTDSLKQIAAAYEKTSGDKLTFNFAASSLLARQIIAGAPADLFFSADEAQMNSLDHAGLLAPGTRRSLLSNSLVIIVASDSALSINSANDLTNAAIKHLALADPKAVPAGVYSREYLTKRGLWTAIAPKVIPTENVRAALAAVGSGNVEAGMVYKTDAAISKKVKVACEIPISEGPAISYPVAIIKDSKNPEAARKLLEYLQSPGATHVFENYGFILVK
ncbi:MAG TPA: molybdate ABC transporter substrate-binding protein [Verrucomicrobiae bacterium]|nr:molybdate ABC transporter substrate-binding protein [Verrucomicrobiae bacterium]